MEKVEKKWDKIDEETSNTLFTYWDKMNEPLSAEDQNRVNTVEKALNDNFNNKSNGGKAKARASKPKVYVGPKGGKYTLRKDGSKKYL